MTEYQSNWDWADGLVAAACERNKWTNPRRDKFNAQSGSHYYFVKEKGSFLFPGKTISIYVDPDGDIYVFPGSW